MAALSLGASMFQRSIERRFSTTSSSKSLTPSQMDGLEAAEPEELEAKGDRTPCFDLAEDIEAGFMTEAFMAKDTTSPVQPKEPFRRCCIFHVADSADEFHLLSEGGDQLLTAKYVRRAARIDFFFPKEESRTPRKEDSSPKSQERRPAFVMIHDLERDSWLLKQTDCEYCMQRPKHLSCEALGRGQQVASIQHSLRPVGKAQVNFVDIRIPPVDSGPENSIWCTVAMGRDLCGRCCSNSIGYASRRNSAPALRSCGDGDSPKRALSESSSLDDGSLSPARSPTRPRCDPFAQPLRLHTRAPIWDEELESLVLNFTNRTVQSSPMNFMLRTEEDDSIIMQHAKMAPNTFGLDYKYPLSTIQAFALALTALSWD